MSSCRIVPSISEEIQENFDDFCTDGNNFIKFGQIPELLFACGENIPAYKLRKALEQLQLTEKRPVYFDDFLKLYQSLSSRLIGKDLVQLAGKKSFQETGGTSHASAQDTKHSYSDDDRRAFAEWLNDVLGQDGDLNGIIFRLVLCHFDK